MSLSRRNWLKAASLLSAGLVLPRLKSLATPYADVPPTEPDAGPIRLCFNENPYGPSKATQQAMAAYIGQSNHYQWSMIGTLVAALGDKHKLAQENILLGAGSTAMIDAVIQLAGRDAGSFVLAKPTFGRWADAAVHAGLQQITVPLNKLKVHDLPAMLAAIRPDTRLVYVCNPNNPTGTICDRNALLAFIKEASSKALVLVDEAYLDYTDELSLAPLVADNERLLVVKTFSKIYGMAGARTGYLLGHARTIERLGALQSGANIGVSAVSMAGALAALSDTTFVTTSRTLNKQVGQYTLDAMAQLHIRSIPTHTNFIYLSLADYPKDFFKLLETHHIMGTGIFEEEGRWTRITIGTQAEMQQFIAAIS